MKHMKKTCWIYPPARMNQYSMESIQGVFSWIICSTSHLSTRWRNVPSQSKRRMFQDSRNPGCVDGRKYWRKMAYRVPRRCLVVSDNPEESWDLKFLVVWRSPETPARHIQTPVGKHVFRMNFHLPLRSPVFDGFCFSPNLT